MNHSIFKPNTLSIFTDAAVHLIGENKWNVSSVAIAFNKGGVLESQSAIIEDATNNVGELYGIQLGVDLAYKLGPYYMRTNLYSDSELCVKTLKGWVYNWIRNTGFKSTDPRSWKTLRTSSGAPVANKVQIINLIDSICALEGRVPLFRIFHVKAHSIGNPRDIMRMFLRENKIPISIEDARELARCNDMADAQAKTILEEYNRDLITKPIPFYVPVSLKGYYKVMNEG